MRGIIRHILCLILSFAFFMVSASASFSSEHDAVGHWAESQLEQAVADGFLQGFEDGSLHPDAPISKAEMLTILCRVLQAERKVTASSIGLNGTEWYADTAQKAAALGLINSVADLSKSTLSRKETVLLLSRAFGLYEVAADPSPLTAFSDAKQLSLQEARAFLALLRWDVLQGYEDQTLRPNNNISRAEFITLLYRLVPYRSPASEVSLAPDGGLLLSDNAALFNATFSAPLYLDCQANHLTLSGVLAPFVVVRSDQADSLYLCDNSQIDTLLLSGKSETPQTIDPKDSAKIKTLIVGDHSGNLTVDGNISRLEVTGHGQVIKVTTKLQELLISGSNCQLVFAEQASVRRIQFTKDSSENSLTLSEYTGDIVLDGTNNRIESKAEIDSLSLHGKGNELTGSGMLHFATIYSKRSSFTLPCEETLDQSDQGILDATLTLTAPELLPINDSYTATVSLQNPEEKTATLSWMVEGIIVKEETITIGPETSTASYSHSFTYSKDMKTTYPLSVQLSYTTQDGEEQTKTASAVTTLENHSQEYYERYSKNSVLSRVTTGYRGDYTRKWAEQNDYDAQTKEIWINAKQYSSQTDYLVWINITYQHVNIFKGSQGNWALEKSYLVGTGSKGRDTPVGVYTVGTRSPAGWTTDVYNVRPVIRFKMGSGLAFHSRIYDPAYTHIIDGSIGYPVSHGCIRMYDEDVDWMYDNIPKGTTVVVY